MMTEITVEKLVALGGKRWQKGDMDRVYFNYEELASFYGLKYDGWKFTVDGEKVSNNSGRYFASSLRNGKFWFDLTTGEFASKYIDEKMTAKIIDRITEAVTKVTESETKEAETKTDEPEVAEVAEASAPETPAPVEVTAEAKAKAEKLIAIGGKRWQKGNMDRVYIPADLIKKAYGITITNHGNMLVDGERVSRSRASALRQQFEEGKVWYDLVSGKWMSKDIKDDWAEKVFDRLDEMAETGPQEEPEAPEDTAETASEATTEATTETASAGPAPVEMAQGMTRPKSYRTNRKPGRCRHCGGLVPAGEGYVFYVDPDEAYGDSGWIVEHKTRSQCEEHHATKTIYG